MYYLIESDKEKVVATGSQNKKRPADVTGCAVAVARLSFGDEVEVTRLPSGRVRSGLAGAKARTEAMPVERRKEIAQRAATARWKLGDV